MRKERHHIIIDKRLISSSFCLPAAPPSDSQTQPTMRTVACVSNVATPRPALTPLSTRCPSVPPEKSPHAGLCSSRSPGLHLRPSHKELSQSGVESSGYSSSEGPHRQPAAAPSGSTSRAQGSSGAPSAGYGGRVSSALFTLMGGCGVRVCLCVCACLFNDPTVFYILCRLSLIDGHPSTVESDACGGFRYGVRVYF